MVRPSKPALLEQAWRAFWESMPVAGDLEVLPADVCRTTCRAAHKAPTKNPSADLGSVHVARRLGFSGLQPLRWSLDLMNAAIGSIKKQKLGM